MSIDNIGAEEHTWNGKLGIGVVKWNYGHQTRNGNKECLSRYVCSIDSEMQPFSQCWDMYLSLLGLSNTVATVTVSCDYWVLEMCLFQVEMCYKYNIPDFRDYEEKK